MTTSKYLLIQARKKNDPMQKHEKKCFARALKCNISNIKSLDIIRDHVAEHHVKQADAIILVVVEIFQSQKVENG